MDILIAIALTFIIGVIASFIGAITGGAGLIVIPSLIFLGLPPHVAIATNKFTGVGLNIGAFFRFWKGRKIVWSYTVLFSLIAIISGLIGGKLLLEIDEELLSILVGIIILSILPLIFIKKEIGIKNRKTTKLQKTFGLVLYSILMVLAGFFGGGVGILTIYCSMFFFGFTIIKANATDCLPWLLLSFSTLIFFMVNGIVHYQIGIALLLGTIIGGNLGARTAIKKGDKWVKMLFGAVVLISGVKILFF